MKGKNSLDIILNQISSFMSKIINIYKCALKVNIMT